MTTKKKKTDWKIVCTAILALVGLEIAAMFHGINGKFFATILAIISGLAGLSLPQIKIIDK